MTILRYCNVVAPLCFVQQPAQASCGSAFCSLDTNWDTQTQWGEHEAITRVLPLLQDVRGTQLTADWAATLGLTARF